MVESTDDDNQIKWASIPLAIPTFFRMPRDQLNDALFNTQIYASVKYDGTNVGRDETGLMYGRNKTIKAGTKSYQKTSLDKVEKINTAAIKAELVAQTGIPVEAIETLVVYGELMCNKDLFRYNEENLFGTCPVFGAMIKASSNDVISSIADKLGKANFACKVRSSVEDGAEPGDNESMFVMIVMNQTWKDLITKIGLPTVPAADGMGTFYELVIKNYNFMVNGNAEGLIIVSPSSGPDVQVSKWKIGAEANSTNTDYLDKMILEVEAKGEQIYKENKDKAKELFEKMYAIASSMKKVVAEKKAPEVKPKAGGVSAEAMAQYEEPIKSAKSKFDHCDVYFAKDKNPMKYSKMIAQEVLSDIKIDDKDKKAMQAHEAMVLNFIKLDFAEFKKNEATN